ncbi:MAG: prepilin-type N-terminal cleavage/methylation domain-containing protein [Candidatus Colwellbacteria bacterium]|nr:prepilin-type N-terminal cleavage/methylation domain-containing protein [Candidatus Colwellbacteria bacterium]
MREYTNSRGFTMIEILLVIGITGLLTGILALNLFGSQEKVVLDGAVSKIVQDIRTTMSRSEAQEDGCEWSMQFVADTAAPAYYYDIKSGGSGCTNEGVRSHKVLDSRLSFELPDLVLPATELTVVFRKGTGQPNTTAEIIVHSASMSRTIEIQAFGVVAFYETSAPPPPPPESPPPQCSDLIDNDGDSLIDYPLDPGCSSASDNNETDPVPPSPSETPDVTTVGAVPLTEQATLSGSANPNGSTTRGWFRLGTSQASCNSLQFNGQDHKTAEVPLGSDNSDVPYSLDEGSLQGGTTYYFCAVAENLFGTSYGLVQSFTTQSIVGPTVVTLGVGIDIKSATLPSNSFWFSCNENFLIHKIYCFGGRNSSNQVLEYNPAAPDNSSAVVIKSVSLAPGKDQFSCAQDSSTGKIYCFGGINAGDGQQIIEYTDDGTSSTSGSITVKSVTLPTPRYSHSCAENSSTHKIYCFGGHQSSPSVDLSQIVEYNPSTDTIITKTAVLPTGRYGHSCTENSSTHKIYCFGGTNGGNQIIEYTDNGTSPLSGSVVVKSATLPTALSYLSCSEDSLTHKIYCFGGTPSTNQIIEYTDDGTSPLSGSVVVKSATLPTARYGLACAENSSTHKIYCFGGSGGGTQIVEYSDIISNSVALEGSANPNGTNTTGYFRYSTTNPGSCNNTFGTRVPLSGGTVIAGTNTAAVVYTEVVSGLANSITYYFCAVASNSTGTGFGSILSFTTSP